ncbi:MAG: putative sulfate exporter family transporter [Planctomycetaceae bacterium]|nr:putative sulfate exporter family transporter [Planctomycetaceae bacterium]MCB9950622.1 putative sulfate exporter family transporter [Planctomycetaceae bacterium]
MSEPETAAPTEPTPKRLSEDFLAIGLGLLFLLISATVAKFSATVSVDEYRIAKAEVDRVTHDRQSTMEERKKAKDAVKSLEKKSNPLAGWIGKPGKWTNSPWDAFVTKDKSTLPAILVTGCILLLMFRSALRFRGDATDTFLDAFPVVFLLATLAYLITSHSVISHYNLEYALWALIIGLVIANTVGVPDFLRPAVRTEFYIKTGLVIFGAEVLFGRLLSLGVPGLAVGWIVTPVVLISTYLFGQYILKIESKSLNMVISADMSVCGVSAAIATAAACKAKKEELSTAISISLIFTVIMMVVMPFVIKSIGLSELVGGAWIGGTIDSSGAVAAAGEALGPRAQEVAITVKLIQNILIGVVSFCVAYYWVTFVDRTPDAPRPGISEIWLRFPKFVLGFLAASIICSIIAGSGLAGELWVGGITAASKSMRGWCFCLAFVSIGLSTNFGELAKTLKGGKPIVLYVCGQSLNLVLTLFMAWLMYEKVFPQN